MSDEILSALISGFMGLVGGLVTIPINMIVTMSLKRDEIDYQHKIGEYYKKREMLFQHQLELEKISKKDEFGNIKQRVDFLEKAINEH